MGSVYFIAVCFGIPVLALAYFLYRRDGRSRLFLTGVGTFAVSQLLIRVPLLNLLTYQGWFVEMKYTMPAVTALFYGFSAGIFEEVGRYLGFRIACSGRSAWKDGVALGLGHGGVEAVWVGIQGMASLSMTTQAGLAIGGFERMCTILIQTALAVIVVQAIRRKSLKYLWLAIGVHAVIDSPLSFMPNIWVAEGYIFMWAALGGAYLWHTGRENRQKRREKFV